MPTAQSAAPVKQEIAWARRHLGESHSYPAGGDIRSGACRLSSPTGGRVRRDSDDASIASGAG